MRKLFFFLLGLSVILAGTVLVLRLVIYDVARMDNLDMWPTCGRGAWMLVNRRVEPRRGDLVVFQLPGHSLQVRRVMALPGQKIAVRGGAAVVDGVAIEPKPRAALRRDVTEQSSMGYFVMADNRDKAADSREYGPVARENIRGVVQLFFTRGDPP